MIFLFLQYTTPTWYFNLRPKGDTPYWVDWRKLEPAKRAILEPDTGYHNEAATLADAAYQAWLKGIMERDPNLALHSPMPVTDRSANYRFARKWFHPAWSWFTLAARLATGHNPFREVAAFWRNRGVKRQDPYRQVWTVPGYETFQSPLLARQPKVSVIIPTLNRYEYLADVLRDLEKQDYKNFEVLVCDQSEPVRQEFYAGWKLDLHLLPQEEKALWLARNRCIQQATGEYILLFDDDSRVEPDWIQQHLKELDFFHADISSGVSLSVIGDKIPPNYSFFCWSAQIDTGNVLLPKAVFAAIGLFDRQFEKQRCGDAEYGLRCYLAGFRNVSNPLAKRVHLKVATGGLRQMGSWDGVRPKNWLAPRPIPSVLYLARKYYGTKAAILMLLSSVPPSVLPLRCKRNRRLMALGFVLGGLLLPILLLQVLASWCQATAKLRQGAMIEMLGGKAKSKILES
jgi:hypothetical protein